MPHDRRTLDEGDRPRKVGVPVILWVLLGLGGVLALGCGVTVFAVLMYGATTIQSGKGGGGVVTRTYTREEFRTAVVGKTEAEVIAAVGKPDSTSDSGTKMWIYKNRTTDPVTGKTDPSAFVHFGRDGAVETVNY